MISKKCMKCEQEKPLSEYYKHSQMSDGTLNKCKECTRIDVRKNRRKNADYYKEYDKKRGNRQAREYFENYNKNNPEKYKAKNAVNNAIRDNRITKESCFMCGDEKTVGHHVDYSKPLEVIWLCQSCHKKIHAYEDKADEIRNNNKV